MKPIAAVILSAALFITGGAQAQTQAAPPPLPPVPAPAPSPAPPKMTTTDPVALFETVCIGGQARLSKKQFEVSSYAAMPAAAKTALGFAIPAGGTPPVRPAALPASDVPNMTVAALPEKDTFLLLPAFDKPGKASNVCAVVWQASAYAAARDVVKAAVPDPLETPGSVPLPGVNFILLQGNGLIAGAAEFGGWTVLRKSPDPTTAPSPEN